MQKEKVNLAVRSKKAKEQPHDPESAPSRRPSPFGDMVKAPRSKGCRVCVQRRIKCDQTRPSCQRCEKANRQCPGYETIKFVDEGPNLQDMYRVTGNEGPSRQTSPSSSDLSRSKSPPTFPRTLSPSKDEPLSPINENNWKQSQFERNALITMLCPSTYQDQLLSNYIDSIRTPVIGPTFRCHSIWLTEMAERPTQSTALVWAIRAISISFLGRRTLDETLIQTSRRVYGKALLKLNDALQTDEEGLSSDTLSATVLLSMYEIFNCTSKDSWIKHAGGAGNLIRLRGPNRHRSGFGRTVFVACRYTLMTEAFHTREPCFLAEPKWRELCAHIQATSPTRSPITDSNEAFFQEVVSVPGYIRNAINLVQSPSPSIPALRACLNDGRVHRTELRALHARNDASLRAVNLGPVDTASSNNDAQLPIVYSFPDIHIASLYNGFWSISVGINVSLVGLEAKLAKATAHDTAPFTKTTSQFIFTPSPEPNSFYSSPGTSQQQPPQQEQIHLERRRGSKPPRPLWDAALSLSAEHPYMAENRHFAHQVCKSVEYMASSALIGPLFVVFSLRMALRVLRAPEEKRWAVEKLGEIGKTVGLARSEIEFAEREGLVGGFAGRNVKAGGSGMSPCVPTKGIFGSGGKGFWGVEVGLGEEGLDAGAGVALDAGVGATEDLNLGTGFGTGETTGPPADLDFGLGLELPVSTGSEDFSLGGIATTEGE